MPTNDDAPVQRLLGPAEIRALAEKIGIRPSKSLGQNFVLETGTVRKIVSISGISPNERVLEIGPGLGSLTLAILEATDALDVVEIDSRLATLLPETLAHYVPNNTVTILHKDALTLQAQDLPQPPQLLVANLPYNVSVPVLLHVLSTFPSVRRAVVMVQKEVADRLAADPGSKTYGIPSVKARYFGQVHKSRTIARTVFWPEPHIDSALTIIDRHKHTDWPQDEQYREKLFTLIDAAFSARRKTLRQSLASWAGSPDAAHQLLTAANIDSGRRAETLHIDDFVRLLAQ